MPNTELEDLTHDIERHLTSLASAEQEIDRLRDRLLDAELALNVWDKGHDSEWRVRMNQFLFYGMICIAAFSGMAYIAGYQRGVKETEKRLSRN